MTSSDDPHPLRERLGPLHDDLLDWLALVPHHLDEPPTTTPDPRIELLRALADGRVDALNHAWLRLLERQPIPARWIVRSYALFESNASSFSHATVLLCAQTGLLADLPDALHDLVDDPPRRLDEARRQVRHLREFRDLSGPTAWR
ncbi:MAG: hypothetical protein AAF602_07825, partial [Myxococcota bacterium]